MDNRKLNNDSEIKLNSEKEKANHEKIQLLIQGLSDKIGLIRRNYADWRCDNNFKR